MSGTTMKEMSEAWVDAYFLVRKADLGSARIVPRTRYPASRREWKTWAPTKPVGPVRRTRGFWEELIVAFGDVVED